MFEGGYVRTQTEILLLGPTDTQTDTHINRHESARASLSPSGAACSLLLLDRTTGRQT